MKLKASIFWWLLLRDIKSLQSLIIGGIIDGFIWAATNILIFQYILPYFGITNSFGSFIWAGTIITVGFFESANFAHDLVNDIATSKIIEYHLTLPIPAWLLLIKIALGIAINCMALSIFIVPLGKLLLWDSLSFNNFSILKFIALFFSANLFFGVVSVWIGSWARDGSRFAYVRRRFFNPFWAFGGYQFTWAVLAQAYPRLSLLALANPLTYAFEGMRSATLGAEGYLPFWICLVMLWVFIIIFGIWAYLWLKKRLDFIG
jgi:hypothetical protein